MNGSRFLARAGLGLGVVLGALGAEGGRSGIGEARADDSTVRVETPVRPGGVTGPTCILKGTSVVPKGTQLFDAPVGGRVIATFTGNPVPMQMSDIPADPTNDRAKVSTSLGSAALRLDGYLSPSVLSVFTTRDIPVMAGNVWISSAQKVKIVRSTPTSLTVELRVAGSQNQAVRGTLPCEALSLQRGTRTPMEVPDKARGYLSKQPTIELFDKPNGDVIFTLQMLEGSSQLFWSTEAKAGFVHVQMRADLTIDAWVRYKDLEPLKQGEMMDQFIPPATVPSGVQFVLDKPPPLVKATKDIPIRGRRDEKAKPIGVIEAGAEIYVTGTMAGWSSVLPKDLNLLPPEDSGFWIPSSEKPN